MDQRRQDGAVTVVTTVPDLLRWGQTSQVQWASPDDRTDVRALGDLPESWNSALLTQVGKDVGILPDRVSRVAWSQGETLAFGLSWHFSVTEVGVSELASGSHCCDLVLCWLLKYCVLYSLKNDVYFQPEDFYWIIQISTRLVYKLLRCTVIIINVESGRLAPGAMIAPWGIRVLPSGLWILEDYLMGWENA